MRNLATTMPTLAHYTGAFSPSPPRRQRIKAKCSTYSRVCESDVESALAKHRHGPILSRTRRGKVQSDTSCVLRGTSCVLRGTSEAPPGDLSHCTQETQPLSRPTAAPPLAIRLATRQCCVARYPRQRGLFVAAPSLRSIRTSGAGAWARPARRSRPKRVERTTPIAFRRWRPPIARSLRRDSSSRTSPVDTRSLARHRTLIIRALVARPVASHVATDHVGKRFNNVELNFN